MAEYWWDFPAEVVVGLNKAVSGVASPHVLVL